MLRAAGTGVQNQQAEDIKKPFGPIMPEDSPQTIAVPSASPVRELSQQGETRCSNALQNEVSHWCRDSIGLRIDFNPFATTYSPSHCFDAKVARLVEIPGCQLAAEDTCIAIVQRTGVTTPTVRLAYFPKADSATEAFEPKPTPFSLSELQIELEADTGRNSAANGLNMPPAPTVDEQLWLNFPSALEGSIYLDHGVFRAAMQQPLAPLQPLQPVQPPSITPYEPSIPGAFETLGTTSIAELAAAVGGGPAQGVSQGQAQALASNDIGGLLQSANSVQSVNTTRRSPVALVPNVRGYEFGQIYAQATGAYWFPVREDLDSMLSKVDPGMIQEVVVIPGPYGLRYGPGFSFIDIITQDTPRYDDGPQSDYRANGDIHTNGAQLYGRFTVEGGSDDYGYRISYGHRTGDDYEAGNGLSIPSNYNTGDVWAQFGVSTSKYDRVEGSFLRLDQNNVQYAAQFFDVDTSGTFGTTLKFVDEAPTSPWTQLKLEGWWNRTQFTGSITPSKSDPDFPVITRVDYALDQEVGGTNTLNGNTLGENTSSGARAVVLYGDVDDQYLRIGGDFHFQEQGLQENYVLTSIGSSLPPVSSFSTNQPFGQSNDGGFFSEYCVPVADGWKATLGGRVDWIDSVQTQTNFGPTRIWMPTNYSKATFCMLTT